MQMLAAQSCSQLCHCNNCQNPFGLRLPLICVFWIIFTFFEKRSADPRNTKLNWCGLNTPALCLVKCASWLLLYINLSQMLRNRIYMHAHGKYGCCRKCLDSLWCNSLAWRFNICTVRSFSSMATVVEYIYNTFMSLSHTHNVITDQFLSHWSVTTILIHLTPLA